MKVEILDGDQEYVLEALERRLVELGKEYQNTYQQDLEISALQRAANQMGTYFHLDGGNTGFKVRREDQ